jgi:hypothetical protein
VTRRQQFAAAFFIVVPTGSTNTTKIVPRADAWMQRDTGRNGIGPLCSRQRALLDQFSRRRVIDFVRQYF